MNILIPDSWLREHLDTNAKPADIARCLSLAGPSIDHIHTVQGEPVYDIEVTTNRVDAMSVSGIAREAATILPEFGFKAKLRQTQPRLNLSSKLTPLDLSIKNDPALCDRILAIKLKDVQLGPSPLWLQNRLRQVGLRPLNNAIDITNYAMWEYGHPIHAFDYDSLTQKTIIVREAKKGEQLTTLDDKTFTLHGGEVIFDDGTGTIIDLPGIMGTKNTVVSDKTKNVLLWIETVKPEKIRFASMTHAIRSQAAILNEKRVAPELAPPTFHQAISLFQKLTGATPSSQIVDLFPGKTKPVSTTINHSLIEKYIGGPIKPDKVKAILIALGCVVKSPVPGQYHLTPPPHRQSDLLIPADYIEEVARIYGYHNIKTSLMATAIPTQNAPQDFAFEGQLKELLAGWGCQETYTYSMVSKDLAQKSGQPLKNHVAIKNPYSSDMVYLRQNLLPSLAQVISINPTYTGSLFELQNVYVKTKPGTLPQEILTLSVITNQPYNILKGFLDALMLRMHIKSVEITPDAVSPLFKKNTTAHIIINHDTVGSIGQIYHTDYYGFELNVYQLRGHSRSYPRYLPVYTKPPVIEDLTFTLKPKTLIGPLINHVKRLDPAIISVNLKSAYKQNVTLTITYRLIEETISQAQVNRIRDQIIKELDTHFQATLVGSIN